MIGQSLVKIGDIHALSRSLARLSPVRDGDRPQMSTTSGATKYVTVRSRWLPPLHWAGMLVCGCVLCDRLLVALVACDDGPLGEAEWRIRESCCRDAAILSVACYV